MIILIKLYNEILNIESFKKLFIFNKLIEELVFYKSKIYICFYSFN